MARDSQLLPRGAAIVRLLTDHFRHSGEVYSSFRIKLYDVSRQLLVLMGAGELTFCRLLD